MSVLEAWCHLNNPLEQRWCTGRLPLYGKDRRIYSYMYLQYPLQEESEQPQRYFDC